MRHRMMYVLFLGFLFITIPYLITVSMTVKKNKIVDFQTYNSKYKIISQNKETDLETYLLRILPGQISMDYKEETLKAQVVILRTDIIRRMGNQKKIQAEKLPYEEKDNLELKEALGNRKYQAIDQLRKRVVSNTLGNVITYKGTLIEPYYHGVSVGMTLGAEEWMGKKIPYLRSKDSLKDVEAPDYITVELFTYGKIGEILKEKKGIEMKMEDLKKRILIKKTTGNGYVKQVQAGTLTISGERWAEWFHLASNNFYLEPYDGKLRIICLGKGNGLGMSQYGANEMAKRGEKYQRILKYYYSGIKIKSLYE
ncbi:SpoIID/LytB domain-containing protein [Anaerostipes faecalis]|uniref:SpoIID/LytB domain-containing protein n=1 Tax=Anaerostipes faecalis TaxID=2738446 RepID=UPI003EFDA83A